MADEALDADPEFDAWYQAVVNGQLLLAIRSGDVADILRFIDNGGDIHNSQGYLLTQALNYHEQWESGSAVHVVVEQMFGTKAYDSLLMLKELGYSSEQITATMRDMYLSGLNTCTQAVAFPEDMM